MIAKFKVTYEENDQVIHCSELGVSTQSTDRMSTDKMLEDAVELLFEDCVGLPLERCIVVGHHITIVSSMEDMIKFLTDRNKGTFVIDDDKQTDTLEKTPSTIVGRCPQCGDNTSNDDLCDTCDSIQGLQLDEGCYE